MLAPLIEFGPGAPAGVSPAGAPFQHPVGSAGAAAAVSAPESAAPVAADPVIFVLDGSVKGAGKGRERGPEC